MKAAVYYETGGPEVFHYEDVPDPVCGAGSVLIDVGAISIEGGDTLHLVLSQVRSRCQDLTPWPPSLRGKGGTQRSDVLFPSPGRRVGEGLGERFRAHHERKPDSKLGPHRLNRGASL